MPLFFCLAARSGFNSRSTELREFPISFCSAAWLGLHEWLHSRECLAVFRTCPRICKVFLLSAITACTWMYVWPVTAVYSRFGPVFKGCIPVSAWLYFCTRHWSAWYEYICISCCTSVILHTRYILSFLLAVDTRQIKTDSRKITQRYKTIKRKEKKRSKQD